jgi:plasmid maintenance system killer protein
VDIEFSSNRLSSASTNLSESSRLFGVPIGWKFIQRLAILRAVDKFSQLYGLKALPLHPLKGNRSGQHAITFTGKYRLIIEKKEEDVVRIVNVENYLGD